jgi:hypothetical protein
MYAKVTAHNEELTFGEKLIDTSGQLNYRNIPQEDLISAIEDGIPIFTDYDSTCREGLLYEIGIALADFNFLRHSHKFVSVEIEAYYAPSTKAMPYVQKYFEHLQQYYNFTFKFDVAKDATLFYAPSHAFNVPLFSALLHLIIYGRSTFNAVSEVSYDEITKNDLYQIVDGLLEYMYIDETYLAFGIWANLKYNDFAILRYRDSVWGNSLTGIAHHIENRLRKGRDLTRFTEFIKLYDLNIDTFGGWLSWLVTMNMQTPFKTWKVKQY